MHITYVKGASEKFICVGNRYNIKMIFKTKHSGVYSWKPGWKAICNGWHSVSSVFPVNVAKQADLAMHLHEHRH
jgi:hypothetical protein